MGWRLATKQKIPVTNVQGIFRIRKRNFTEFLNYLQILFVMQEFRPHTLLSLIADDSLLHHLAGSNLTK